MKARRAAVRTKKVRLTKNRLAALDHATKNRLAALDHAVETYPWGRMMKKLRILEVHATGEGTKIVVSD
jgi:hypothetical protein